MTMNNCPKVSILLASYNSSKTIKESLLSILSQSYPNLQLILCDDGTENFNRKELEAFIQKQKSNIAVRMIHQPHNLGTVRNLNAGLEQADGEWIMLLAADDCFVSEQAVERLMARVLRGRQQWAIARTALCDEQLVYHGHSVPGKEVSNNIIIGNIKELYLQLCMGCCLPAVGSVYKADLLKQLGGFDETYRLTEDWPLFLKLVRQGLLPAISDEDLILHRFGGVSWKNAGRNFTYQNDLITILRNEVAPYIDLLDEHGQRIVRELIQDKEASFEFRFSCRTRTTKLLWIMTHPRFIIRKVFLRREKRC